MEEKMKRIIFGLSILALASMPFMSCTKKSGAASGGEKVYKIGISKIQQHPALDDIEKGIQDQLAADGIKVEYDLQNANGDMGTATQIATLFKSEGVDYAIGIATPTAIALANTITNIPVIFSCVTDPVNAGLVDSVSSGKNNVTGLSDAVPTANDIRFFKELAGIKTLGYIYTSNEDNSISSLAEVRAACAAEGIELVEQSITKSDEVKQAAEAIVNLVDGIYLTTDNTVFSALSALVGVFNKAHKPIYSADVTGAQSGGIAFAKGFNYYKSGLATAKIVERCMKGEKPADIPVVFMTDPSETDFLLDLDTIADCGLTISDEVRKTANLIYKDGKLSSVSF